MHTIPFDHEVPPFMIPYIDPSNELCLLYGWDRDPNLTNDTSRLQAYREHLEAMVQTTLIRMESDYFWFKFEGTNWYACAKLNNRGSIPRWDYELFTNEIATFRHKDTEKWNFVNHHEKDVDVLINTRNELNIFGTKFPLKSRNVAEGDELDIGLYVKAIDDVKQTQSAVWYSVKMNLNEQDILQTYVETPKELTKYSGFSAYEKEKMIRELGLRGQEYLYNKQMLQFQKDENKFTNQYEKDWIYKEWKYQVARGATQIIGGAVGAMTGGAGAMVAGSAVQVANSMTGTLMHRQWADMDETFTVADNSWRRYPNSFRRPYTSRWDVYQGDAQYASGLNDPQYSHLSMRQGSPHWLANRRMAHYGLQQTASAVGGLMGMVEGGLTIAEAYETFNIKDTYRRQKYALAEQKIAAAGDILNKRHEFERKNLLNDLWSMSANVVYPQLNANIVYKLYNQDMGIRDIHIVQYFPSGKLKQRLKDYYKEFGYNILVRDFECTGIDSIRGQIRFQFIYDINHPNVCITEMIRARALQGVKIAPWKQANVTKTDHSERRL